MTESDLEQLFLLLNLNVLLKLFIWVTLHLLLTHFVAALLAFLSCQMTAVLIMLFLMAFRHYYSEVRWDKLNNIWCKSVGVSLIFPTWHLFVATSISESSWIWGAVSLVARHSQYPIMQPTFKWSWHHAGAEALSLQVSFLVVQWTIQSELPLYFFFLPSHFLCSSYCLSRWAFLQTESSSQGKLIMKLHILSFFP